MIKFETSCVKRPLHNEYGYVICSKKLFIKNNVQATKKKLINFLFHFELFHVFLVKILRISVADQNRCMHVLYKNNFQI